MAADRQARKPSIAFTSTFPPCPPAPRSRDRAGGFPRGRFRAGPWGFRGVELAGEVLVKLADARRRRDRPLRLAQLEHVQVARARLFDQLVFSSRYAVNRLLESASFFATAARRRGLSPSPAARSRGSAEISGAADPRSPSRPGRTPRPPPRRPPRPPRLGVAAGDRVRAVARLPQLDRRAEVLLGGRRLRPVPVVSTIFDLVAGPHCVRFPVPSRRLAASITCRPRRRGHALDAQAGAVVGGARARSLPGQLAQAEVRLHLAVEATRASPTYRGSRAGARAARRVGPGPRRSRPSGRTRRPHPGDCARRRTRRTRPCRRAPRAAAAALRETRWLAERGPGLRLAG